MTGRVAGVAARLKCRQRVLTSIHCIAHRLALAAGQAGEKIKFLSKTLAFKAIEQILELPELKAADTRSLSHDSA